MLDLEGAFFRHPVERHYENRILIWSWHFDGFLAANFLSDATHFEVVIISLCALVEI